MFRKLFTSSILLLASISPFTSALAIERSDNNDTASGLYGNSIPHRVIKTCQALKKKYGSKVSLKGVPHYEIVAAG